MSDAEDPRSQYRHLPEPVRPEELVETSDVTRPVETEPQPDIDFRLVGFATWANFLVTKRHAFAARPVELLTEPGRLRAWLRAVGLEPAAGVGEDDLTAAIELREALHVVRRAQRRLPG